jgi:hypothetical protein
MTRTGRIDPSPDPDARWADEILAPLRRERLDLDVAPSVMSWVEEQHRPAGFAPLPGDLPRYAWAASLILGLVCLGLLVATCGVMILGGDEGARTLLALTGSAGRMAILSFGYMLRMAQAFGATALTLAKGAWTLIDVMAPLVRGAGFLAAVAGALSIGISSYVFANARRSAPIADRGDLQLSNGGLS